MSLNSDYFITAVVQQRVAELTAEAERDRLARAARAGRPSWLQRVFAARRRSTRAGFRSVPQELPNAEQAQPAQPQPESEPSQARRELVGSGRVNGL